MTNEPVHMRAARLGVYGHACDLKANVAKKIESLQEQILQLQKLMNEIDLIDLQRALEEYEESPE